MASRSGADGATLVCYLHQFYDGKQPGGCPTVYFRDKTPKLRVLKQHQMWVALEAGSGVVSQHDYGERVDGTWSRAGWCERLLHLWFVCVCTWWRR